jgi:hypothetical protein
MEFFKKDVGASEKDVYRVLRPGGPLDILFYRTKCKACGLKVHRPFRWFMDCNYRCSCGGKFDFDSLAKISWRLLKSPMSPDEVRELFKPDLGPEEDANGRN